MNNKTFDFRVDNLPDEPIPRDLHAKIMKRVFIAGYGKYLYLSTGILFTNLAVLGAELYRKLSEIEIAETVRAAAGQFAFTPGYIQSAIGSLYDVLPVQSIVATSITACLCAYMSYLFVKFHRDPQSIGFFRGLLNSR
jgi:hypothetical protein